MNGSNLRPENKIMFTNENFRVFGALSIVYLLPVVNATLSYVDLTSSLGRI